MIKIISTLLPLCILANCGNTTAPSSELQWAHSQPQRLLGSIYGYTASQRMGYTTDSPKIRVCLGRNKFKTISDNQLELEAKLAYVAWLRAASPDTLATDWQRYEFVRKPRCENSDTSFLSVINLPGSKESVDSSTPFNKPDISCNYSEQAGTSCRSNNLTLGWGSTGSVTVYTDGADKWTRLKLSVPALITMSPFVNWQSLESQLDKAVVFNGDSNTMKGKLSLSATEIQKIRNLYKTLASKSNSVSLSSLLSLLDTITSAQIIIGQDNGFSKRMSQILNAKRSAVKENYVPEYALFHTLIHEIGHQFGMSHADNPSRDDVTGLSQDATQANGIWKTNDSAMAYGLSFAFLREDDILGIQNLASQVETLLRSRL